MQHLWPASILTMSETNSNNNGNESEGTMVNQCLGTKRISIKKSSGGEKNHTDGMMAIFRPSDNDDRFRIIVTDGNSVYEGSLVHDDIKKQFLETLKGKTKKKMTKLAGKLLKENIADDNNSNDVWAEFFYEDSTGMEMAIKYKIVEGGDTLTKRCWKQQLQQEEGSTAMLAFCNDLGDGINQLQHTQVQLNDNIQNLRQSERRWKHNSDRLEGEWQSEKDQMLQNFLLLYNNLRSELSKTRIELAKLRQQRKPAATVAEDPMEEEEKKDDMVNLGPDDNDDNIFSDEMVDRLAKGLPIDRTATTSASVARKRPSAKNNNSQSGVTSKKKSTTGTAVAVSVKIKQPWDTDSDDDVNDNSPQPPIKKKKLKKDNASLGSGNDNGGAQKSSMTKHTKTQNNNDDSDSDW